MAETALDYQLLAVFVAVAELASFSKAAHKLGVGKGTVSRAIARLERVVGAELLHRTTHRVALSTAGSALYERVAPHLTALNQAVVKLPERGEEPSGPLRMTAPHDFGAIVLPGLLSEFARRFPKVTFDVRLTNARVDLVAEGFDLAVRAGPANLKDSTLAVRRLGPVGSRLYAAPSYLARRGKPKQLGEAGHDWVLHPFALRALKLSRAPHRFLCDDFLLVRELLRQGSGIGLLPPFVADAYLREGLLEELPLAPPVSEAGHVVLLYPSSGQVPRKVAALRDFLVERLKKTPLL